MNSQPQPRRRVWQWALALGFLPGAHAAESVTAETGTREPIVSEYVTARGLTADQVAVMDRIVEEVVEIRGLELLEPLDVSVMSLSELQEILLHQLNLEFTPSRLDGLSIAFQTVGAIPPEYDLLQGISDLLMEQIGGLYDDQTRRLCIMEWINLGSETARLILAHEVCHALQDQHFNLLTCPIHLRGNDDRAIAAMAMIEGDATVLMSEAAARHGGIAFLLELPQVMQMDQSALAATPRFVQGQLIFPYLSGQSFLMPVVMGEGGRSAADNFMRDWPDSTEQLLHFDRSRVASGKEDEPTEVNLDPEEWGLTSEWTSTESNVFGEFGIRQIFQNVRGEDAVAISTGWDGDRWGVWRNRETGAAAFLWSSVWDTERDAEMFAAALNRLWPTVALTAVSDPQGNLVYIFAKEIVRHTGNTVHTAVWNETGGVVLTPPETSIDRVD